jgi:hypothetical protein
MQKIDSRIHFISFILMFFLLGLTGEMGPSGIPGKDGIPGNYLKKIHS